MLMTSRCFGKFPISIALATLLGLAGCATRTVPAVDMNETAVTKTKRIALLKIAEPNNVAIVNLGGAAGAFGLVGGLIQAGNNSSHTADFLAEFHRQKRSLAQPLTAGFSQAITDAGYEVVVVDQKPKPSADGKSDDYSEVHVDADAIASVWCTLANYYSPPNSNHYEPMVVIRVRIIDAGTKQDLYFKTFSLGQAVPVQNAVHLPADPKARFDSFDDIMKHFDAAVAGLTSCGDTVVKYVVADLRKPGKSANPSGGPGAIVHPADFKPSSTPVGTLRVYGKFGPAQIQDAIAATFRDREWDVTEKADGHVVGHIKHRSSEAVLTVVYDTDFIQLYCEGWKIDKETGARLKPDLPNGWIENIRNDLNERLSQAKPSS